MQYVYSTLTGDQEYTVYAENPDAKQIPKVKKTIRINGGANVINKHLITPKGVVTEISDDQAELLETIPAFKKHKAGGFVSVESKKADPEKVAKQDLTEKDGGAQLTDDDFDNKPETNKGKSK